MEWSTQQQAVFDWVQSGTGSAVVEAVAGAGKTTTVVEAVRRMQGRVFMGAYNQKMGQELKKRVCDLPNVVAGTFHSAGFYAMRRAAGDKRLNVDGNKVRNIVQALLMQRHGTVNAAPQGWAGCVVALVSMAKQCGFYVGGLVDGPRRQDWADIGLKHEFFDKLAEECDPNRVIDDAVVALRQSNEDRETIDFDDMVYLPLLRNLRMFENDWVIIDEAQDTNAVRRLLARRMLKRSGRLIAVGDPHQAIFGFTGADGDSLDLIRAKFCATTLNLSVTYRCPSAVVSIARQYVQHIEASERAPIGTHSEINYAELPALVAPGDAILCRFNAPIVDLCFSLIRAGKPAKIEGRDIGEGLAALAGRWKAKSLDMLETRLSTWFDREVRKAEAKDDQTRLGRIEDQYATLQALISRGRETGITTVDALKEMIRNMFDDVGADTRMIVLSSVHRAKGLEWPRVFILGRRELMPSKRAVQDWAKEQEINLIYVAVTRAQQTLVDVAMPDKAKP